MFKNKAMEVRLIGNIEAPKDQVKVLKQTLMSSINNTKRRRNQIALNF